MSKAKKVIKDLAGQLEDDVFVEVIETSVDGETKKMFGAAYCNLPDLQISTSGSVKSLKVKMYSSQARDEALLHKLYGKVRDLS
jgi:hypothetical protein